MSGPAVAPDGIAEFLVGAGTRMFRRVEQRSRRHRSRRRRRRRCRRSLLVALTRAAMASLAAYLIVWSTAPSRLECANTSPLLARVGSSSDAPTVLGGAGTVVSRFGEFTRED